MFVLVKDLKPGHEYRLTATLPDSSSVSTLFKRKEEEEPIWTITFKDPDSE